MAGTRRIVLSGCSGGGKSTLLAELGKRGFATVSEPGREIVRDELENGGRALPWIDPQAFADRAIEMGIAAFDAAAGHDGPVFFDRSLIDAVSDVEHRRGELPEALQSLVAQKRYDATVFMVPPWPEIYVTDTERQHGFDDAVAEYERLMVSFETFGYSTRIVSKGTVAARADHVLDVIGRSD